jgi:hypothetical protein
MNKKTLPGKRFKSFVSSSQSSVEKLSVYSKISSVSIAVCEVTKVRSKNMTADVLSNNGIPIKNIPIITKGGLIDDEVWGELELPCVGSFVIVAFIGGDEGSPFILGTLLPYLNSLFQSNQTVVNSTSKTYTTKLLEEIDTKVYRKIFQSGTTIEVDEDGTLVIETPGGAVIKLDESAGEIVLEDSNGNDISMETGKVVINGNLEVLQ